MWFRIRTHKSKSTNQKTAKGSEIKNAEFRQKIEKIRKKIENFDFDLIQIIACQFKNFEKNRRKRHVGRKK